LGENHCGFQVPSMLCLGLQNRTPSFWSHLAFIDKELGFQRSPPSCHVWRPSWHDFLINPTWQQIYSTIVARYTSIMPRFFQHLQVNSTLQTRHNSGRSWHDPLSKFLHSSPICAKLLFYESWAIEPCIQPFNSQNIAKRTQIWLEN